MLGKPNSLSRPLALRSYHPYGLEATATFPLPPAPNPGHAACVGNLGGPAGVSRTRNTLATDSDREGMESRPQVHAPRTVRCAVPIRLLGSTWMTVLRSQTKSSPYPSRIQIAPISFRDDWGPSDVLTVQLTQVSSRTSREGSVMQPTSLYATCILALCNH